MKYLVDIDGVLAGGLNNHLDFEGAKPIKKNIEIIKDLYESDNEIVIYTSRLSRDAEVTKKWLEKHGIKYSQIIFDKPTADFYIDDKAVPYLTRG